MSSFKPFLLAPLLGALLVSACTQDTPPPAPAAADVPAISVPAEPAAEAEVERIAAPPLAEQREFIVRSPNGDRPDPWYWLRDDERSDSDILAYLNAENAWTEQEMAPVAALKDSLFEEIVGRIVQDDSSVPYEKNGYFYYVRFEEGKEYPIYARRQGSMEGAEEILIDANVRAEGESFYQIGGLDVSPDQQRLIWLEDTVGRRQFTLRARDLASGEDLPLAIERVSSMTWAGDSQTIFYVLNHPETLLSYQVRRHKLGDDSADDPLIYEETDTSFYMGVGRSMADDWVYIGLSSTVSSEFHVLPADQPEGEFTVFFPRERDHLYSIEALGEHWIITTNWNAPNYRVMRVELGRHAERDAWEDVVAHSEDVFIHGVLPLEKWMIISERSNALRRLRVLPADGSEPWFIASDEPAYAMYLERNETQSAETLRYSYTSMTTPTSTYALDLNSRERELLKQNEVLGDFDPANYVTERLWAPARDGEQIPVTLLYRKGIERDATAPLYQYAYGSYGSSSDPTFSSQRLSLVDRGFVFAIAHIRGGQDVGRRWYDDGRLLNKINTFNDFIDVTQHLINERYADPDKVFAMGGSAGGLLMGAVANMAPELYTGMIAHVPFVDVVTTMLDESIPLTTNEFDEWGNPMNAEFYDYILSYSPYDQVSAQDYPHLLVTTGLWDSQVQYWEPAKWVARLRLTKTDDNKLLMYTNMDAGHGGASGRFERLRLAAMEYAFIFDLLDIRE